MAKKKRKTTRHKKQNPKRRKSISATHSDLLQRVKRQGFAAEKVLVNPANHEKMSEVILKFAEPLLTDSDDEVNRKTIEFAVIAWNYALIREHAGEEAVQEMMAETAKEGFEPGMLESFQPYFEMLFQRKRELFPDNQRLILDYQITEGRDNFHLNVVSVLPEDQ